MNRARLHQLLERDFEHGRAFQGVKELLGKRPQVLGREFSYLGLLERLEQGQIHFVIRLNMGSNPPIFTNAEGEPVKPVVLPGQQAVHRQHYYRAPESAPNDSKQRTGKRWKLNSGLAVRTGVTITHYICPARFSSPGAGDVRSSV